MRVYVGIDPVSKKKHFLTETVPAGPKAAATAEKVRTRLLGQVDERRAPRTNATVKELLTYLEMLDVERRHESDTRASSGSTSARCSVGSASAD